MLDFYMRYAGPVRPESTNTTSANDAKNKLRDLAGETSSIDSFTLRYAGPQRPVESFDDLVNEANLKDSFTLRYAGPQRPESEE